MNKTVLCTFYVVNVFFGRVMCAKSALKFREVCVISLPCTSECVLYQRLCDLLQQINTCPHSAFRQYTVKLCTCLLQYTNATAKLCSLTLIKPKINKSFQKLLCPALLRSNYEKQSIKRNSHNQKNITHFHCYTVIGET